MFMVTIMADVKGANGEVSRVIVGDEYGSWIGPDASYALRRLVNNISPRNRRGDAPGVEHNYEVIVYRAEQLVWGEGDLSAFDGDPFEDIVQSLANRCILDEDWREPTVTSDERAALATALDATLAAWAREHKISSGVWHEVGEPLLTVPAYLDDAGEIAVSDEDEARIKALA